MFGLFQARLTKEQRWGSALLSRNHSLEEEFERAKAAVEVIAFKIVSLLHVAQSEIKKIYIKLQEATHKWVLLYRRDCLNETRYQRTSDFPSGWLIDVISMPFMVRSPGSEGALGSVWVLK